MYNRGQAASSNQLGCNLAAGAVLWPPTREARRKNESSPACLPARFSIITLTVPIFDFKNSELDFYPPQPDMNCPFCGADTAPIHPDAQHLFSHRWDCSTLLGKGDDSEPELYQSGECRKDVERLVTFKQDIAYRTKP